MHPSAFRCSAACLSAILLLASPVCGAEDSGGTLGMYMENDLFANTDRYYTSGIKLTWSSSDLEKYSDTRYASPFLPLFDALPYINETNYQKNLVFALGQNIYTPEDTATTALIPDDRPYAGWLYFGLGVVWKNAEVRNSLVMDIGVVGPWSYAEEGQRLIHDLRGLDHPRGWDNQLDNELGVSINYQRTWRFPKHERRAGLDWEALPFAGVTLGNVRTSANLGSELRVGFNLPDDFGTAAIGTGATTSNPVDGQQAADRARFDVGFYLFARADGQAVAHNIFLDGNTFSESPSVSSEVFVADLSAGAAVNFKNTKLAYAMVYRTKEFEGQDAAQVFGTVSLNWTF
jgi:lipid A 3-O-deacylase